MNTAIVCLLVVVILGILCVLMSRQLDRLLRDAGFDVALSEKTRGELTLECRPR